MNQKTDQPDVVSASSGFAFSKPDVAHTENGGTFAMTTNKTPYEKCNSTPRTSFGFNFGMQSQDLSNAPAVHPQYAPYSVRITTFENWPRALPIKAHDLCQAGLFYTGRSDTVQCFYCSGKLHNWGIPDNPAIEHARHYPDCLLTKIFQGL